MRDSAIDTADDPKDIEFVHYIDEDDVQTYAPIKDGYRGHLHKWIVGPRIVLSQMWNKCHEAAKGPYYFHAGDDLIFRTQGWDMYLKAAIDQYPDKIAFVHGRDGSPHDGTGFGTHGMIHKNWVDTVGYFVPKYFSSDYNDAWLNEVSRMIKRHVCVQEVLTEHMHPNFGKGPMDQTHIDRLERHTNDNVDGIYEAKAFEREADAAKLIQFIKDFK